MRGFIAALILALAATVAGATPALADVPLHLHCLHTPGTTTAIAGGVTANASHEVFSGFHAQVHLGALANPTNPVFVTTTSPTGSC